MVDVITLAHSLTWTRILDKGQRPRWLLRNVEASLESIRKAGVQSEVDGKALRAACPSVVSTGCCTRDAEYPLWQDPPLKEDSHG